jgi:hypothetical protein
MTVSRCLSGGYTFLDALLLLRYPPRATLERLDWTDVKIAEKRVIVPRYKGKNQLRYRVTLSDNALEWLRLHVHEKGSFLVAAQATNRPGWKRVDQARQVPADSSLGRREESALPFQKTPAAIRLSQCTSRIMRALTKRR